VRELSEDLKKFRGLHTNPDKNLALIAALRDTYKLLEINGEPVRPLNLVVVSVNI
jgi:hypothetical protein